jgi:Type I phosphodiesterase / nucleotide pyrophosphatase
MASSILQPMGITLSPTAAGLPDYRGAGIVNLMTSLTQALGGAPPDDLPPLDLLPPQALAEARNILLLVLDGLGYDYLQGPGRGGQLHARLLGPISSVAPPTTAAAIPAFLTGQPPARHGLTGWFMWLRELGCVTAILPYVTRHGGHDLAGTGPDPQELSGVAPLFDRAPVASHLVSPASIAQSIFNRSFTGNACVHPYADLTGLCETIRRVVRGSRGRKYIYAYWPQLDNLAHDQGIASTQVRHHFAQLDAAFGRLLRDLAGSDTAVLVTADHGFIDSPPERHIRLADHPELERCLVLPLCGEPRFAYCYLRIGTQQRFLDYIEAELAQQLQVVRSSDLMEQGLLGPAPFHPKLGERLGDYVLVAREDWLIKDRLAGEKPFQHIGVHGGLSTAELTVPLVYATV